MNHQHHKTGHVESESRPFNFETISQDRLSDQSQATAVDENDDSDDTFSHPFYQQQQELHLLHHQAHQQNLARSANLTTIAAPLAAFSRPPQTPSPRPIVQFAPTPPFSPTESSADELYGPDRLFGPPIELPPFSVHCHQAASIAPPPPVVTYHSAHGFVPGYSEMDDREAALNQAMLTGFRDELVREAGVITPGVDDTPYLQYALDALTRDVDEGYAPQTSGASGSSYQTVTPAAPRSTYQPGVGVIALREPESYAPPPPPPPPPPPEQQQQQQQQQLPTLPQSFPQLEPAPQKPQHLYGDHRQHRQHQRDQQQHHQQHPHEQIRPSGEQNLQQHVVSTFNPKHTRKPSHDSAIRPVSITPGGLEVVEEPYGAPQGPLPLLPPPQPVSPLTPEPRVNEDELPDRRAWTPFEPWHKPHVLPLGYKPLLLRPFVILAFAVLVAVMIVLLFAASIYDVRWVGLVDYSGSIYGLQWFVFRMFPQLLGVGIMVLAQAFIATAWRIQPFRMLGSDSVEARQGAFIRDMYQPSYLWPKLNSPGTTWKFNLPIAVVWIAHFTIPLLSSVFNVDLVDGTWRWGVVQGVAITIIILWCMLIAAFIWLFLEWRAAWTGLLWNPASLADLISLLSRSNNLQAFEGLDHVVNKDRMEFQLGAAHDKLTWWHDRSSQSRSGRWWYSLGLSGNAATAPLATSYVAGGRWGGVASSKETLDEKAGAGARSDAESSAASKDEWYLPWALRTNQLLLFSIACLGVLIVIFILSFVQTTKLAKGFSPGVEAAPSRGVFSAANFLYSFFPSSLGMVLWLAFLGLEQDVKILAPWGEMGAETRHVVEGTSAKKALLADYATTHFSILVVMKALRNRHWRVAAISLMAGAFAFLPVLGGGLFLALTRVADGDVRMYPNFPAYGVLLAVLVLYVIALVSLIPDRKKYMLPHGVRSLGEILSFCTCEELLSDSGFRTAGDFDNKGVYSGKEKRMMMVEDLTRGGGEKKWCFGAFTQPKGYGVDAGAMVSKWGIYPATGQGRFTIKTPRGGQGKGAEKFRGKAPEKFTSRGSGLGTARRMREMAMGRVSGGVNRMEGVWPGIRGDDNVGGNQHGGGGQHYGGRSDLDIV